MNWRDLKPGDRVRVTMEARVARIREDSLDLATKSHLLPLTLASIHGPDDVTWERIDPPLRVGRAKFRINNAPCAEPTQTTPTHECN